MTRRKGLLRRSRPCPRFHVRSRFAALGNDVDEAAAEEARKEAEHALANQSGDFDYGRASSQLAEAAAQLATLRKMKNRAGRG